MSLQTRVTTPTGVPGDLLSREIGLKLQQAAEQILSGLPPEKYPAAVERYKTLYELLGFMEDYIAAQAKGEAPLDED